MEIFTHQWIYFLILLILVVGGIARWKMYHFEKEYRQDVIKNLQAGNITETEFVTEADLISLPSSVKRYLIYAGVINKPRVKNVRIVFKGEMREKGKGYFPFRSEQYNFFDEPARLFFMKATIMRNRS